MPFPVKTNLPDFIKNPNPDIFLSDNFAVIDFETTNLDKGSALNPNNRIVNTSWWVDGQVHNHYGNAYELNLTQTFDNVDFIVAHNTKFEIQWLMRLGLPVHKWLFYDTLLGEYVLAGNRKIPLDLGSTSKRYGFGGKAPFVDICMKGGVCPSEMPRPLIVKRCIKDVQQTLNCFKKQRQILKDKDQLKTTYTRCILTPALADIEFKGIHLDKERVNETYRSYVRRYEDSRRCLDELTSGINLRSRPQLGEFLYDRLGFSELKDRRGNPIRTAQGARKTDSSTLEKLVANTDEQRAFLQAYNEFNSAASILSKNLQFFKGVIDESEDGIFFGQFNQAITQTHRLSSSGRPIVFKEYGRKSVQFQNLPRAFKKLFSARNAEWRIGEVDGSQLEFRVAAHLGRDEVARDAIQTGFDVHKFTACVLTDAGQPTERQGAKSHTFKPLYGGRSGTKAEQAYYAAFRERYRGITGTQEEWIAKVLSSKELTIPSGLTFYWPDTKLDGDYVTNTPSICNYPVQSYATADIIPIAVTKLWYEMKYRDMQSFLVNTIHDSAIGEIHPDEVELFKELAFDAFTAYVYFYLDKVYNDKFTVPLGAECKIGTHWSEGEEFKYNLEIAA